MYRSAFEIPFHIRPLAQFRNTEFLTAVKGQHSGETDAMESVFPPRSKVIRNLGVSDKQLQVWAEQGDCFPASHFLIGALRNEGGCF